MPSSLPLIVVTEPEFRRSESVFVKSPMRCVAAPPVEADFARAVREHGARHAIVGPFVYTGELYAALRPGAVLARYGVGHDGIDKPRATAGGLFCTNTPGVLHQSVAEFAMLLMLAAARHLEFGMSEMRAGRWAPRPGRELAGSTLAIIGCGTIGRTTARMARAGFGMRVIGYRRSGAGPGDADFDSFTNDFAEAVRDADYVSLHIPATPDNMASINAARLAQLRPGAWLINTARGAVVDEAALFDALAGERLGGAAIDVFEREPYVPSPQRDLRTLSRVILAPHVGSNTAEANVRMAGRALHNIALAERGEFTAMDLLNPDVLRRG